MDVSVSFDIPNVFGLRSGDFGDDLESYRTALAFLSDLAGGSEHDRALTLNGGSQALLTRWKGNGKFRVVYEKCRRAADSERKAAAARKVVVFEPATAQAGTRFIPLEDVPVVKRTPFNRRPNPASWGGA